MPMQVLASLVDSRYDEVKEVNQNGQVRAFIPIPTESTDGYCNCFRKIRLQLQNPVME